LDDAATREDPVFGLEVPTACPGVPPEVLNPKSTWSDGAAYDAQASKLAGMFRANFEQYGKDVSAKVAASGPR
ncbi:MAG: phosphoenolpyruvate carboxykinase (ATP), partial [Gemmatimonadota bacterium]|nr:phosphoenolpyruvate carboxykinase (ATP) [Gemmatimonadota bacterium]